VRKVGLRSRLSIETTSGKHYEFSVWDIDTWVLKINKAIGKTGTDLFSDVEYKNTGNPVGRNV